MGAEPQKKYDDVIQGTEGRPGWERVWQCFQAIVDILTQIENRLATLEKKK